MKVYESEAVAVPPAGSADRADVPMSVAPVPELSVALWKRFVKPDTVEPVPLFETVAENVVAVPATAAVGETAPAMRSGKDGTVTVTVTMFEFAEPPGPVQVT